jgi:hypothetical protein
MLARRGGFQLAFPLENEIVAWRLKRGGAFYGALPSAGRLLACATESTSASTARRIGSGRSDHAATIRAKSAHLGAT